MDRDSPCFLTVCCLTLDSYCGVCYRLRYGDKTMRIIPALTIGAALCLTGGICTFYGFYPLWLTAPMVAVGAGFWLGCTLAYTAGSCGNK